MHIRRRQRCARLAMNNKFIYWKSRGTLHSLKRVCKKTFIFFFVCHRMDDYGFVLKIYAENCIFFQIYALIKCVSMCDLRSIYTIRIVFGTAKMAKKEMIRFFLCLYPVFQTQKKIYIAFYLNGDLQCETSCGNSFSP